MYIGIGQNTHLTVNASYAIISSLDRSHKSGHKELRKLYHYTDNPNQLIECGFKNFTPQEAEDKGMITTFGCGVYLTTRDISGSRVQVRVKAKKIAYLDYNNHESVNSLRLLLNESSINIDDWYVSKIGPKLQNLGYDALDIKVDFTKLTPEDHEADLESLFGTEHQLLVFNANDAEVIP